jgi:uncharacterized membrane protein
LSDRALRALAAVVALCGIGVAGYLTWAHFQHSSYSEIAGVPVALLGLLSYAAILGLIAWDAPTARLAAAALALVGVLFGAYLLVVQLFVIDAVCVWCVVNDVLIAPALAVSTALRLRT